MFKAQTIFREIRERECDGGGGVAIKAAPN